MIEVAQGGERSGHRVVGAASREVGEKGHTAGVALEARVIHSLCRGHGGERNRHGTFLSWTVARGEPGRHRPERRVPRYCQVSGTRHGEPVKPERSQATLCYRAKVSR